MKKLLNRFQSCKLRNQRGVTLILVAILMLVFLGIAALAIDLSNLYVVRNELQNAADAGALAGARFLYNEHGTAVNSGANLIAYNAATANKAMGLTGAIAVDVNWPDGTDVQRGHWSFATRIFTANDSLVAVPLWGVSDEWLDNPASNFINAVRVVTRRETTPVASFFARIFGHQSFQLSAEAVAYIGFAGTLEPGDVDAPIAICKQSLTGDLSDGCDSETPYECNMGYMLSDGQEKNTAAWTNFSQPCSTADTGSIRELLTCTDSNPYEISLGAPIGATNGVVDAVINHPTHESLIDCWKTLLAESIDPTNGLPTEPWNIYLPVVNCPDLKVGNCMETCGAVNVNVVWILEKDNKIDDDAPYKMADWNMEFESDGKKRWDSFVTHFNLRTPNGSLATYDNGGFKKKSIYFLPDCTPHELKGNTGGRNFGVLARIPVLVQ
jgi:Flp pilus assembly protein TadG